MIMKVQLHVTTWVNLTYMTLSKRSKTQKRTYTLIPLTLHKAQNLSTLNILGIRMVEETGRDYDEHSMVLVISFP